MKNVLLITILIIITLIIFTSCGSDAGTAVVSDPNGIRVFTREEGSGTRDAFFELIGMPADAAGHTVTAAVVDTSSIDDEFADNPLDLGSGTRDDAAELIETAGGADRVLRHATVAGGTGAITNAVAANPLAIGYISLGAMKSDVRALPVDGVTPSKERVMDGSYPLFRSFYIAVPIGVKAVTEDFISFILSVEGQEIISGRGYVAPIQNPMVYSGSGMNGTIRIEGSTSVAPVMRALADAYMKLHNNDVTIEVRATGSGAGITAARERSVDIGISSRQIRDTELVELRDSIIMAHDGIAVIVHPSNTIRNVSIEDIRQIFSGELVRWDTVGAPPVAATGAIRVFTREHDSGTRSAFTEMTGIFQNGADRTLSDATIAGGTGAIINAVAGNPLGIGYISLGAMRSDVRALSVNGAAPSVETVIDRTYPLTRSFYLVVPTETSVLAGDFIGFIQSAAGQEIISGRGYVSPIADLRIYNGRGMSGTLQIEGSTSVSPVMNALAEAYMAIHGTDNVMIEVRATGSGAGITAAMEGVVDIGLSSRSIRRAELAELSDAIVMAHDGIAVIVHPKNALENVSIDEIRKIFTGEVARWEDMEEK